MYNLRNKINDKDAGAQHRAVSDRMITDLDNVQLRNKTNDKDASAQHRAVSGRMITDLEMNGTYRRAVQITNLCRHLRHDDVLFAECTSTLASCQLYGRNMN